MAVFCHYISILGYLLESGFVFDSKIFALIVTPNTCSRLVLNNARCSYVVLGNAGIGGRLRQLGIGKSLRQVQEDRGSLATEVKKVCRP